MATATKNTDPAELRQEAGKLLEKAAAVQAQVAELEQEDAARRAEQQVAIDKALVATYRSSAYDQEVEDARAAVEAAVSEMPVTQALGRYLYAQARRSQSFQDLLAARSRLGMPTDAQHPPGAGVPTVDAYVPAAAQRIANQLMTAHHETETS